MSWTLPPCGHLECADHPETCPDRDDELVELVRRGRAAQAAVDRILREIEEGGD